MTDLQVSPSPFVGAVTISFGPKPEYRNPEGEADRAASLTRINVVPEAPQEIQGDPKLMRARFGFSLSEAIEGAWDALPITLEADGNMTPVGHLEVVSIQLDATVVDYAGAEQLAHLIGLPGAPGAPGNPEASGIAPALMGGPNVHDGIDLDNGHDLGGEA